MPGRSILYICDFNAHGGTQTHLLHLLAGLDRTRFRPSLVTLNLDPALRERLLPLGVEVTDLGLRGFASPATWRAVASLAGRARLGRTDLLHGFLYQGNVLTALISALADVPCVTSVRNMDLWMKRRHRLASALAHRLALRVVFNSRRVRDHAVAAERIPPDRAVVISNGIHFTAAQPDAALLDPERPTILCVASLTAKKGHRHLLEAMPRVIERVPRARLLLAGHGPLRDGLEAQARSMGLGERVRFLGHRPDVAVVIAAADVVALASLEEGMPNALLEAMAAARPVVATAVGGSPEVVEQAVSGLLVPPADPAALADALSGLLADAPLARRMGEAGRCRFEASFTAGAMVASYHRLYDELLG